MIFCGVMNNWLSSLVRFGCGGMKRLHAVDWLAPLAIRLYLVPVFWVAGTNKWHPERGLEFTARFFDRLGYPLPELMAFLACATEVVGAVALAAGAGHAPGVHPADVRDDHRRHDRALEERLADHRRPAQPLPK